MHRNILPRYNTIHHYIHCPAVHLLPGLALHHSNHLYSLHYHLLLLDYELSHHSIHHMNPLCNIIRHLLLLAHSLLHRLFHHMNLLYNINCHLRLLVFRTGSLTVHHNILPHYNTIHHYIHCPVVHLLPDLILRHNNHRYMLRYLLLLLLHVKSGHLFHRMNLLYNITHHLHLLLFLNMLLQSTCLLQYKINYLNRLYRLAYFLNSLFPAILSVLYHIHSQQGHMYNPYIPACILLSLYIGCFQPILDFQCHTIHPVHYNLLISMNRYILLSILHYSNRYLLHNMSHNLNYLHTVHRMLPYHMHAK